MATMLTIGEETHHSEVTNLIARAYISFTIGLERRDLGLSRRGQFTEYLTTTHHYKAMARRQSVYYVTLAIHFTYDEDRTSLEDAIYFAKDLAIEPDYNSLINGVALKAVRIDEESEY